MVAVARVPSYVYGVGCLFSPNKEYWEVVKWIIMRNIEGVS